MTTAVLPEVSDSRNFVAARNAVGSYGISLYAQLLVNISAFEEISEEDGVWTAVDVQTGIFGSGESEAAALHDFNVALAEHFDVLRRQDELSAELAGQLAYLRFRLQAS